MSHKAEADEDNLEFKWGKKRGVGGKKKEIQFYESFTYDGVEYTLHDCVFMHKEGEPEPYIGKLIKIWENPDKSKKVKVHWFFRPSEVIHWLRDEKALENEIFLASGEGVGLANVNPLEAIAGKCNVVCISKDSRNPQPSKEELKMSDYLFYRTFDVQHCTVLDKMDDKVGGVEIKFIFNRKESENGNGLPKSNGGPNYESDKKDDKTNVTTSYETPKISGQSLPDGVGTVKTDGNYDHLAAKADSDVHDLLVKRGSSPGDVKDLLVTKESLPAGKPELAIDLDSGEAATKRVGSDDMDERLPKKSRIDYSSKQSEDRKKKGLQNLSTDFDENEAKDPVASVSPSGDRIKSRLSMASLDMNKGSLKEADERTRKLSNGKLPKESALEPVEKDRETDGRVFEVTRRPDADKSKWFRALPWEERMQNAHEQGTLVLLQNLDPSYTSEEVEDIIWSAIKENCSAKMVQHTTISSPHLGQAFVIFKTPEVARRVIQKLEEGCLMLSNGRPLVGSTGPPPSLPRKQSTFVGHLHIDKIKLLTQREMKDAVSTSHCSQPNTIEYEMAMEWCLLQSRSDSWWKRLYKQHGDDLKKIKANLKSK